MPACGGTLERAHVKGDIMQVGVFSFVFQPIISFEQALDWIAETGATMVEIGSGGYVAENGKPYCIPRDLLDSPAKLKKFR
jgi:hypothetical protein